MNTQRAVEVALAYKGISKYQMAKDLGLASSTSINQWLRGTKMSTKFADKFKKLYGITVDDAIQIPDRPSQESAQDFE